MQGATRHAAAMYATPGISGCQQKGSAAGVAGNLEYLQQGTVGFKSSIAFLCEGDAQNTLEVKGGLDPKKHAGIASGDSGRDHTEDSGTSGADSKETKSAR